MMKTSLAYPLFVRLLLVHILLLADVRAQSPGNALHFDGSDDYVAMPLPALFNAIASQDFTIEFWIKPESSVGQRVLYSQFDNNNFASILINSSQYVYVYVYKTGQVNSVKSGNTLALNQWSHVAFSWSAGTGTISLFINGVQEVTTNGGSSSTGNNNEFCLGKSYTGSVSNFNGQIDELRIWDTVRTPCQISTGMPTEYNLLLPNLVAYYQFNQGVAGGANAGMDTLNDNMAAYQGQLNGFALSGNSSNWVISNAGVNQLNTLSAYNSIDSVTACESYQWMDGVVYTVSNNVATYTIAGVAPNGCDSVFHLQLTINNADTAVSVSGVTLTAMASGATYQWLDCGSNYAPVPGATATSFTPSVNGSYAVKVTQSGCTDTSACYQINSTGIIGMLNSNELTVFPNPGHHNFTMVSSVSDISEINIWSGTGQLVCKIKASGASTIQVEHDLSAGIYTLQVLCANKTLYGKLLISQE